MTITLYEYEPTRSARVRWTLQELDAPFESIARRELIGSEELREVHPQAKLPAIKADGKPLFESAAICTWLADSHPEIRLVAPSGTWDRALHDQWVAFTLSEIEAYLWSTSRNMFDFLQPKKLHVPDIIEQNNREARRGLAVLEDHLSGHDYLVAAKFSVADIITGFAINWADSQKLLTDFPNLQAYTERLFARPHCTLRKYD